MAERIPAVIAVIGAGTMGAGIAQLAAQTGARTLLHDPFPGAVERGLAGIAAGLEKLVAKGRIEACSRDEILGRLEPAESLEELAAAGLVIEAVPERMEIKLDLFGALAAIVADDCVLATNTSSLSVTEIAAGVPHPERVVGMHFFNPAPVMKLMEVVAGEESGAAAVATARAVGVAMGKHVIDAADVAGFLVNRVNRPYSLESLYLLEQRVAEVEQIDRITRLQGGFRMGPFELMDLIGIETNHAVAEGFRRQSYGEPRYRPSPLAARKIAAKRLGRKTGRGWYGYGEGASGAVADPAVPEPVAGVAAGRVLVVAGDLPVADALRSAAAGAGWTVVGPDAPQAAGAVLALDCGDGGDELPGGVPRALLLHRGSLHALDPHAVGFHVVPPLDRVKLLEFTVTTLTAPAAVAALQELAASLGWLVEEVGDAPGLVLGRVVAQLINEAAFLLGEGNGTPEDVDAGMRLGVNHPRGPVAWCDELGTAHVVSLLAALQRELGEDRYRTAPLLRRRHAVGAGLGSDAPRVGVAAG
jgi:3-hydroxybutyryl-CoA dehydrogenase